ncbi:hypothetical protein TNCV_2734681 [Trichonephila clavipes]|nr:hypothetical protein TNCV_2734681 [Trichonephila clavipes]
MPCSTGELFKKGRENFNLGTGKVTPNQSCCLTHYDIRSMLTTLIFLHLKQDLGFEELMCRRVQTMIAVADLNILATIFSEGVKCLQGGRSVLGLLSC